MYSMSPLVVSCEKPLKRTPASLVPSKSMLIALRSFASVSGNLCSLASVFRPASSLSREGLQLLARLGDIFRERLRVGDGLGATLVRLLRAAGDVADRTEDETKDDASDEALLPGALASFLNGELVDLDALRLRRRRGGLRPRGRRPCYGRGERVRRVEVQRRHLNAGGGPTGIPGGTGRPPPPPEGAAAGVEQPAGGAARGRRHGGRRCRDATHAGGGGVAPPAAVLPRRALRSIFGFFSSAIEPPVEDASGCG